MKRREGIRGPAAAGRGAWTLKAIGLAVLVVAIVSVVAAWRMPGKKDAKDAKAPAAPAGEKLYWTVARGPLLISLLAPGTIEAKNSTTVGCQVQGDAKIVFLIEEGKIVSKGDKLVELEVSGLDEQLVNQKVDVASNQAAYDQAVEEVAIQKNKNQSDLLTADNKHYVAELDLKKYKEGEYPQALLEKESAIKVAEAELERARDRLQWTGKLVEKGYVSTGEKEADQLTLTKAQLEVDKARNSLEVLKKYEFEREVKQKENDVREAQEEMARLKLSTVSELRNKQTAMDSAKARLDLANMRLRQLEEQQANTVIRAPRNGMVVYVKSDGWNSETIKEGSQVHFRQNLIDLPDFSQWQVMTRVHESMIQQVQVGQKAWVTVDALPGERLEAAVSKIGVLPDSQRWFMPDTKEYIVNMDLTTTTLPIKPGMSTKNEILFKQLDDVVYVPVQALSAREERYEATVKTAGGVQAREVKIGLNNDRFVEIVSGLQEGEQVLLRSAAGDAPGNVLARPSEQKPNGAQPAAPGAPGAAATTATATATTQTVAR